MKLKVFIAPILTIFAVPLFLLSLVGCEPDKPEDRVAKAEARRQLYEDIAHACDDQGGLEDVVSNNCYKGSCKQTLVMCKNGMQKPFPYVR